MHRPEIFAKMNKPTREGTAMALEKYGHLIQWGPENQDTLIDIGCGPGNVLMDVILPVFKGKYSLAYGTDLSEKMIEYCNEQYANAEKVKFQVLNIQEESDFQEKYGQLDHALSSFVMHWLPDQPKGLRNIFKLLKPGGDFFTVHNLSSSVYEILKYMDGNEKWNRYFDNLTQYIPFSQASTQPEEDLRDMMKEAGFVDIMVDVVHQDMVKESYEDLKTMFTSTMRQLDRIPEELRADYIQEYIDYGFEKDLIKVRPSGEVTFSFNLFIAYGRKPI